MARQSRSAAKNKEPCPPSIASDASDPDSNTPNLDKPDIHPVFKRGDERFIVPSGTCITTHQERDICLPQIYQVDTHPLLPDINGPHRILIIIESRDPEYMQELDKFENSLEAPEGATEDIRHLGVSMPLFSLLPI